MSDIRLINSQEYKEIIDTTNDKIVIMEFFATWCNPCNMLSPVMEEFSKKTNKVEVYKIDVDDNSKLADDLNIHSVPTLLFYKKGQIQKQVMGFQPLTSIEKIVESI